MQEFAHPPSPGPAPSGPWRLDASALSGYITNQSVINNTPVSKPISAAPALEAHKRERRKEARPGELLEAALDLFVEKGYAATRAEEVAVRAGVSKAVSYTHLTLPTSDLV